MKSASKILNKVKQMLHFSTDFKVREVQFFDTQLFIVYIAPLTDNNLLNESVIKPLVEFDEIVEENLCSFIKEQVLANSDVQEQYNIDDFVTEILKGRSGIIIDQSGSLLTCDVEKIVVRPIQEPPTSAVMKGPREGFNESIKYNLSLIRHKLPTPNLVIDSFTIGKYTQTQVAVIYLQDIADKNVVKEVERRISKINIDGVVDSYYIAAYLQSKPQSIFKQVGDTEKPDILVSKMLEGRVGILVDGSPIVLTVPFILVEDLQASDDYYSQPIKVTFLRILRLIGVVLAVLLPGTYVAIQIYHYKILPTEFLITIMDTTQGIPFTPFTEVLFIVLLFEILYEANLHMPQYMGMALSIVGALILGETAVNAGLVSPPTVMIVALSGLTFYVVPNQASQFSMLRLLYVFVGATLGLFGILVLSVWVVSYLCSFDTYESAYLAPTTPYIKGDMKDFLVKAPLTDMKTRPRSIANNKR
ncbi:MAG: spore germination protein, partial [Clostridia bacterium]|nr:spore germination protein [Clostridia bacterium]